MSYQIITNANEQKTQEFKTFGEAKKQFEEELEEWRRYFCLEKISDVFYKIWHRMERGGFMYAGSIYIKKIA